MTRNPGPTSGAILDVAESLAQTRGFNGFSYADISEAMGITKASLHYHFRTKAELGHRLIERYFEHFETALAAIDASGAPGPEKLRQYAELYVGVLRGERMCLCGMLAAEVTTLPPAMQGEIRRFFEMNETWLVRVLEEGRASRGLSFMGSPLEAARLLIGSLEGSMLVARSFGDLQRFERAVGALLAEFTPRP